LLDRHFPLVLTACGPDTNKADTGLVVGAVAGEALIGNQFGKGTAALAPAAGAVVSASSAARIGRSMDKQDRILAQQAELDALERGESAAAEVAQPR
jgi:uncharacterized protein YcfJ